MPLTFDISGKGLEMVLKDYQEVALRYLWRLEGKGASSREVWMQVNEELKDDVVNRESISRASIINFLNSMVDEGVLSYNEITGKGGHRRIYSARIDEAGFKQHIATVVLGNLKRDFPEETMRAIQLAK